MDKNTIQWEAIYNQTSGRQPRETMLDVLKLFGQKPAERPYKAIDLGSGDGTETAFLLANGWHVLAIDSEPAALKSLDAKVPVEARERLQTQLANFESIALTPVDLFYAGYSVPYCHPQHFDALWNKIVQNINTGGRFAGQIFGVKDTWASNDDMTFLTEAQTRALFADFEIEQFHEEDEDGYSTMGDKHWHIFHVIARKK